MSKDSKPTKEATVDIKTMKKGTVSNDSKPAEKSVSIDIKPTEKGAAGETLVLHQTYEPVPTSRRRLRGACGP